jgi:hypothetical protein
MNRHTRNTLKALLLLVLSFTAVACNDEDDINEIFRERTWYLTYVKDGGVERIPNKKLYSIVFMKDNFIARMPNGTTVKGLWQADGRTRTFRCTNVSADGGFSGDTIAEKMYGIIRNAQKYDGDIHWLQIIQDKNTHMQFYNR